MPMNEIIPYSFFGSEVAAFTTKRTLGRDRQRICAMLGIDEDRLVIPRQIHSDRVLRIAPEYFSFPVEKRNGLLEGIDAVYTDIPGVCIGVSTADCVPILLYETQIKAVVGIHAGWRGTVKRIVEKTIRVMEETVGLRPGNVKAVIGPCISENRFEVGEEVYKEFFDAGFNMEEIARKHEKWHIDLHRCNYMQLAECGVKHENIYIEPVCTYDNAAILFSARREQRGAEKCGRNFNAIFIKETTGKRNML